MKVISVVGPHKSGKTTLLEALIVVLKSHGRVGTIKHMPGHAVDQGDTHRHLEAGADVVIGLGQDQIRLTRGGDLISALHDLEESGIDYALVEGFKRSNLPKIVLGSTEVTNTLRKLDLKEVTPTLVQELAELVMSLGEANLEGVKDGLGKGQTWKAIRPG